MRRAVFALLGTTIGTSLLIGAKLGHPAEDEAQVTVDTAGAVAADVPSGAPAPGAVPTASGAPAPGATTSAGARSAAPPASRQTAPTGTKTTTAAPAPKPTSLRSGTYRGAAYTHRYGTVQVTITVSGGVVTGASATYPTDPATSKQINEKAVPTLNSRAVAAKTSANISTVGGATLTSNAYKSSLQSALDKARA